MASRNAHLGIVVGIDGSPAATVAVQWAVRDAELRNIPLTLVHAISPDIATWPDIPLPPGLARWHKDHGRQLIDDGLKIVDEASRHGGPAGVHSELLSSAAIPTLVDISKNAELMVTGCRGGGRWLGRRIGSVSSRLVRHAHCSVAIIHDEIPLMSHPDKAPVLVGIDGSSASDLATAVAFDEASRRNVGLVALHAWSDVDVSEWPGVDWPATQSMAEQVLAERLAGWQEQHPEVNVHRIVVRDQPARQLIEHSEDAQLLVVGSRGRGGFAGMQVGSVSETVAELARVPVIVTSGSRA